METTAQAGGFAARQSAQGDGGAADGAAAYVMEGLPLGGRGDEIGGFDAGRLAMR